jgi:hypothetical protein
LSSIQYQFYSHHVFLDRSGFSHRIQKSYRQPSRYATPNLPMSNSHGPPQIIHLVLQKLAIFSNIQDIAEKMSDADLWRQEEIETKTVSLHKSRFRSYDFQCQDSDEGNLWVFLMT